MHLECLKWSLSSGDLLCVCIEVRLAVLGYVNGLRPSALNSQVVCLDRWSPVGCIVTYLSLEVGTKL